MRSKNAGGGYVELRCHDMVKTALEERLMIEVELSTKRLYPGLGKASRR